MQRHVMVDGKVRTDKTYPAGFMGKFIFKTIVCSFFYFHGFWILIWSVWYSDVVSIPKTNENFRLLYDTKGRFRLHSVRDEEAKVCFI